MGMNEKSIRVKNIGKSETWALSDEANRESQGSHGTGEVSLS